MSQLKSNKSFQFICGCGTLALLFFMWKNNVFSFLVTDEPPEGMESVSLATLAISSLVSAIQLIGILSLAVVSGLLKPFAEWTVDEVKDRFPKKASVQNEDSVDVDKLLGVLNDLDERLKKLEGKASD